VTAALTCLVLRPDDVGLGLSPTLAEAMVTCRPAPAACDHRPSLALVRWQRPYALLGPRDFRLPDVTAGVAFLERRGLPVFRRIGGGSLVVLDEDCLSFALAWPCRNPAHVSTTVPALAAPVLSALAALGAQVRLGAARGSYCEGPSDVVLADGRKVAGMSLALRGGWALLSGMLLVRQDPAYATGLVAGFEAAAGGERRYRADAVSRLDGALGRPLALEAVADALTGAYAAWAEAAVAPIALRPPDGRERARAAELLGLRRVRSAALGATGGDGRSATVADA
jgi:octanoyl-[GcvH]:protein N-octanoyltransferase